MTRRFQASHKIDLSYIGADWAGAYLEVAIPTYGELQAVTKNEFETPHEEAQATMQFTRDHFIGGKAPENGTLVYLKAKDIDELPLNVLRRLTTALTGEEILDPKS